MLVFTLIVACIILSGALCMEPDRPTRSQAVARGADVDLMCVNRTWTEMLYVIWKIALRHRECVINFVINFEGGNQSENTCGGGKVLRNTSSGASYLHIPDFSLRDEGLYRCEVAYQGGEHYLITNLTLSVPAPPVSPRVSAWLEGREQGRGGVAVCVAGGGKPAAAVHWRNAGNLTTPPTITTQDPMGGSFTVRSSLDLPRDATAMENLTCVVTHPSWDEELTIRPEASRGGALSGPWVWLVCAAVLLATLATLAALYFGRKKLTAIRHCWHWGHNSSQEAVSPSTVDVEEVEPYASYVHRVNSLYNSSVDLLT